MGGPIVRSGATPQFSQNWESIFGKTTKKTKATSPAATAEKKGTKKKAKAAVKKQPAKKATKAAKKK